MNSRHSNEVVVELLQPSLRVPRRPPLQAALQRLRAEAHARLRGGGGVARRHVGAVGLAGEAGEAVGRRGVRGGAAPGAAARRARLLVVLLQAGAQLRRR